MCVCVCVCVCECLGVLFCFVSVFLLWVSHSEGETQSTTVRKTGGRKRLD